MAFQVSPGIVTREFDISAYIPGVSSSVAAIGGVFSWGPVQDRTLISNENDLVTAFGKPTDDNYETFLIASNFLAYSNALYVSRAANANTYNASDGGSNIQILNEDDYTSSVGSLPVGVPFIAKYPGTPGNSLRVAVCPSSNAFGGTYTVEDSNNSISVAYISNSNTATVTITNSDSNSTAATDEYTNITNTFLQSGDYLTVSDANVGSQYLKYTTNDNFTDDLSGTVTFDIHFQNRMTLLSNVTTSNIIRNWEYFQLVDRAPGTSAFTEARGGSGDEMHIVVVDRLGEFSGEPNQVLEVFPFVSRATDARAEEGGTNYYKNRLNDSSSFLWAGDAEIAGVTSNTAANMTNITVGAYSANLTGGTAGPSEVAIDLASIARAYDQFKSKEDVDVSLIIAGKAIGGTHGESVANYIIDNIAEVRKDCVVTISPQISDVVNAPLQEVENLIEFRRACRYTSRAFLTSSYKYQFDRYNNKFRWVAGCGDDAGLMARTDYERDPWWSPAGQNRGQYKNIVKLAFNPDQAQRDSLYKEDINPVVNQVGSGVILFGDKTMLGKPSAFDRINVRRLFNTLEKAIEIYARSLLFEFNDVYTRSRFRNSVEPYLRDVQGRRGITRFKVVCDETNNTPVVIDRNEFVGSIYIVPAKSINFITLNFVAVANTVEFSYAIGEVDGPGAAV